MPESTPQEQISRMLTGYWLSQALYVAAKLGLADLVKAAPRSAPELATATGTHTRALYRLLRALASVAVFAEDEQQRFRLTPMAECLLDAPGSQRALAIMSGEEHFRAFGDLLYSVQTGEPAFDRLMGAPVFDFLQAHPEQARIFDEAMTGVHGRETAAMLEAYDFSGVRVLADIGGGSGSVVSAILKKYTQMHGILYDLPAVIERAAPRLAAAGLANRCQAIGGSFFASVPIGANVYLMRHIIHDWDDDNCRLILHNIRQVLPDHGRLLVVESVVPPGNDPSFGKLLDLAMLVIPGGEERTAEEYRKLFHATGFELTRILPTTADVSVIEGKKFPGQA
ncbi:MAG: methyltransferase [Planctomycetes bacterium]|nr:methyltransferase [Planctomycetota bacterium]